MIKIYDPELGEIETSDAENSIKDLGEEMKKKDTREFKKVLSEYNALKKNAGLEDIAEIQTLIEKGDKKVLLNRAKNLKDKTLQKAVLRLAKYL